MATTLILLKIVNANLYKPLRNADDTFSELLEYFQEDPLPRYADEDGEFDEEKRELLEEDINKALAEYEALL